MIDKSKCIKCGVCAKLYPEMYSVNEKGEVEEKRIDDEHYKIIINEVIDACPVSAIYKP